MAYFDWSDEDYNESLQAAPPAAAHTLLSIFQHGLEGLSVQSITVSTGADDPQNQSSILADVPPACDYLLSEHAEHVIADILLPFVLPFMASPIENVRRVARTGVRHLCERAASVVAAQVACYVTDTVSHPQEDSRLRLEALELLDSIGAALPPEICREHIFGCLRVAAGDRDLRIRKGCVQAIGAISSAASSADSSFVLVPLVLNLSTDDNCFVRAECGRAIGRLAPHLSRDAVLSLVSPFLILAEDTSRWVRSAIVESLGAMFAALSCPPAEEKLAALYSAQAANLAGESSSDVDSIVQQLGGLDVKTPARGSRRPSDVGQLTPLASADTSEGASPAGERGEQFFSANATPIPPSDDQPVEMADSNVILKLQISKKLKVPSRLLALYSSLLDPQGFARDVDSQRICAYIFPVVAWAVGPYHWASLRPAFLSLASSEDPQVRLTLARCLHVIGYILGPALAESELLQHVNNILDDWDEIRYELMGRFASFLSVLTPHVRRPYLPKILVKNNDNWRHRAVLVRQSVHLAPLFPLDDVLLLLWPFLLSMVDDSAACVREGAGEAVSRLYAYLQPRVDPAWLPGELTLIARLTTRPKSLTRQSAVQLIGKLVPHVTPAVAADVFLEPAAALAADPVANVRIAVARLFSQVMHPDYFIESPAASERSAAALAAMAQDSDADVRFFSSLPPGHLRVAPSVLDDDS
eukprot:m.240400 g.240400  ORF g.240400 m.240400 type:complete len:701 (-) comp13661_c0_seq1:148-2250(-)